MKKIISGAIALAFLGVIGVVSFDTGEAQSAESIVKTRIEAMRGPVLKNFKTIKAFIKEGKGSLNDVVAAAKVLEAVGPLIPALFPKGTSRTDLGEKATRALAKIWEDMDGFAKAAGDMSAHAGHVAMYAAQGNKAEVAKHFGFMGKTGCGACHKPFRGPKAKK